MCINPFSFVYNTKRTRNKQSRLLRLQLRCLLFKSFLNPIEVTGNSRIDSRKSISSAAIAKRNNSNLNVTLCDCVILAQWSTRIPLINQLLLWTCFNKREYSYLARIFALFTSADHCIRIKMSAILFTITMFSSKLTPTGRLKNFNQLTLRI